MSGSSACMTAPMTNDLRVNLSVAMDTPNELKQAPSAVQVVGSTSKRAAFKKKTQENHYLEIF